MKKITVFLFKILLIVAAVFTLLLVVLYFNQEKIIFFPEKLAKQHQFQFKIPYEEKYYEVKENIQLHALYFKSDSSKGVVYYLHGNAGSNDSWGYVAEVYTQLNYDVVVLDYRGYGKSDGQIESEKQLYNDIQIVYDSLKSNYLENNIVVLGYSIGTGMAAMLAANNKPGKLILLAPYYNLSDLGKQTYPFLPTFIIKYKFETNRFLPKVKCPIFIFHGKNDELILFNSSERLLKLFKPEDKLLPIDNMGHNGINENTYFQNKLQEILGE